MVRKVWIGMNGDIRDSEGGPVIGWATVDGDMFGDFLPFKEGKMQPDPRRKPAKKTPAMLPSEARRKGIAQRRGRDGTMWSLHVDSRDRPYWKRK